MQMTENGRADTCKRDYKRPDVVSSLDLASRSEMLAKAGRV